MKVNSICIVGGGSSGWMMALALNKNLPNINVTLVESPVIQKVGVGESTIPYTAQFFKEILGLKDKEWMPYCNATYKAAIKFNDFYKKGETFYHSFWTEKEAGYNGFDWAIKKTLTNLNKPNLDDYSSSNFIAYHMCLENKFNTLDTEEFGNEQFAYAHHMDAHKFGEFCKKRFKGKHILATVSHAKTERSNIVSVTTDKGIIEADMFVDCSGFKALLIDKTLHEPFDSIADTLLNNKAITCRIPYKNKTQELEPYTDCTALSSGWAWNIPLWHRVGSGYVYSSKFQSDSSAAKEYRQYLTDRFGKKRSDEVEFKTINIKTGKYQRGWVGNCIALTLASGFIEPLESTGLALACYQIQDFVEKLEDYEYSVFKRSIYNQDLDAVFKEIHNFVLLHYVGSKREDTPYWKHIKHNLDIPKSLTDYVLEEDKGKWFTPKSREQILLGWHIPSEYSSSNLMWNQRALASYSKQEQTEMLAQLTYIDETKKYYKQLTTQMISLNKYLKEGMYKKK